MFFYVHGAPREEGPKAQSGEKEVVYLNRETAHFPIQSVGRVGFEPTTPALKGRCSTPELTARDKTIIPRKRLYDSGIWLKP